MRRTVRYRTATVITPSSPVTVRSVSIFTPPLSAAPLNKNLEQRQAREQQPRLINGEILYLSLQQMPHDVEVSSFVGVPGRIYGDICQAKISGEEQD